MTEYEPLTAEEREEIARIAKVFRAPYHTEVHETLVTLSLRYEATVTALEIELDHCRSSSAYWEDSARYESKMRARAEAELTRLRPLADALTEGRWLEAPDSRHETYRLWDAGVGVGNAKLVAEGKTLAELVAALRTAKGEDDA